MDGNNLEAVEASIAAARADTTKPTLIVCNTVIGYGSPNKAGTAGVHGAPLGDDEVELTRQQLHWPYAESFTIPGEAMEHLGKAKGRGSMQQQEWLASIESYRAAYPRRSAATGRRPQRRYARWLERRHGRAVRRWQGRLNERGLRPRDECHRRYSPQPDRRLRGPCAFHPHHPEQRGPYRPWQLRWTQPALRRPRTRHGLRVQRYSCSRRAIPYASTFLIFSDYLRPALRLSALMEQQVIYVFTHDSVGLGEDGPTHQPVEHLMSLREMPGLVVIRPADATETAAAWKSALERRDGPTALALSRQNLPVLDASTGPDSVGCLPPAEGAAKGGYVLWENGGDPQVIIIATGSEVHIALEAAQALKDEGISARLVSMPSWELFEAQPREYRESVLPPDNRARLSVEAGAANGWARYVGLDGASIGMSTFGASAPGGVALERFGFTAARVVEEARKLVRG